MSMSAQSVSSLFDPTRLKIARQATMITKKELAHKVGVSPAAMSQYESGNSSPSAKVTAALALALGVPVGFLAKDRSLTQASSTAAHFRSLRATTQRQRDRAFAHAVVAWDLANVLQRYVRFPDLSLPTNWGIDSNEPLHVVENIARRTRDYFDLGLGPLSNVVRVLESRGIVCTRLHADTSRVHAFSCSFPGRPVVVLSEERTHLALSRFDAAHELGHLILHLDEEPGSHAVERQANAFAAEFIAPSSQISDLLPRRVPRPAEWNDLLELKRTWGISLQALLFRARSLGMLPEHSYRRVMTIISSNGWRMREPGDIGNAERPVLLKRAIDLAMQHGVSIDQIASEVRIPEMLIRQIACFEERPLLKLE